MGIGYAISPQEALELDLDLAYTMCDIKIDLANIVYKKMKG